tara:strand:- start:661 stop:990 length:330 start_codon:yes stop_codon:yes gene_type:complete
MNKLGFETFDNWWAEIAIPRVNYYIDEYLETNPEYTEDDIQDYSDSGCVHRMIHEGEAENMLWDICQEVFEKGYNGEEWEMTMGDSLFCELDDIIHLSYEAGQRHGVTE